MEAPDEVKPNWYYNFGSNTFSESPFAQSRPTVEDLAAENTALKAQLASLQDTVDTLVLDALGGDDNV